MKLRRLATSAQPQLSGLRHLSQIQGRAAEFSIHECDDQGGIGEDCKPPHSPCISGLRHPSLASWAGLLRIHIMNLGGSGRIDNPNSVHARPQQTLTVRGGALADGLCSYMPHVHKQDTRKSKMLWMTCCAVRCPFQTCIQVALPACEVQTCAGGQQEQGEVDDMVLPQVHSALVH